MHDLAEKLAMAQFGADSDSDMAHFGRKLQELIDRKHLTQGEFADRAGISPTTLTKYVKSPIPKGSKKKYREIADALGLTPEELDREWQPQVVPQQGKPGIPVLNMAPAGVGEFGDMGFDSGVAVHDEYLPQQLCPGDDTAFAVRIEGDSMIPEFRQGDLVVCSPKAATQGQVADGDVVHFRLSPEHDDRNGVKRIYDHGEYVELVPDNRAYKPERVLKEHVVRLAKVVMKITSYREG